MKALTWQRGGGVAALRTLVQQRADARADARELWGYSTDFSYAGLLAVDRLAGMAGLLEGPATVKVHSLELEITPP